MSVGAREDGTAVGDIPTLATLCADLGAELLAVAFAPRGLEVPVAGAVVHDPEATLAAAPGDVVLGVGMDPRSEPALDLLQAAAGAGAAALVVKPRGRPVDRLVAGAKRAGVAVLTTPAEVAWGQLYALIRTSTSATVGASSGQICGPAIGDLFALADAIAAAAGGPVTIEDPQSRVLAFSNLDAPIDEGRQATILGRRVPEHWMKRLRETGVFARLAESDEVIRVEFPGQIVPRRTIAVRAGGIVLGSIWVAEGDRPLTDATDAALEEAARIAALHVLRHRVSDDLERRVRGDMVRALLGGSGPAEALAGELGLSPSGTFAVIAVQATHGEEPTASLVHERIVDLIAVYFQSFRRQVSVAALDGRVYVLVTCDRAARRDRLLRLARDAVRSASRAVKVTLRAGVGAEVSLADVAGSRGEAEQALRVAETAKTAEAVVDIEDVHGQALVLEVADFLAAQPRSRSRQLELLRDHDRAHATDYVHTLAAYLDCFGDSALAAERLGVHQNTLRYRLRRIAELTGIDLHSAEQRFPIELQLRLLEPPG